MTKRERNDGREEIGEGNYKVGRDQRRGKGRMRRVDNGMGRKRSGDERGSIQ